jgi:fructoselysine/glucoselysine PTS system EIIB component
MILLCRVDDRLLHGQVAFAWTSKLQANTIVIPNDEAAKNQMKKMTLTLAKPPGRDLIIKTKDEAIKDLLSPKLANKKIFVVVETVQDALYVAEQCMELRSVNLGGMRQAADQHKVQISKQVFLDDADVACIDKLTERGVEVFEQVAPTDKKKEAKDIKNMYKK